jgi:hypothetical protein
VRRLLSGHSIASGDKYHNYHRMLELGLSRRAVVLLFHGLCIVLGMIDLRLKRVYKQGHLDLGTGTKKRADDVGYPRVCVVQ